MECPICHNNNLELMLHLECGKPDNSTIYNDIYLMLCKKCGHIYNNLTEDDVMGLMNYYDNEYAPANLEAPPDKSDRPGNSSALSIERYDNLYAALSPYLSLGDKILDVGCALGGFLEYLSAYGYKRLHGIDIIKQYVDNGQHKKYELREGNACNIPYNPETFDVVITEQVMEHLLSPEKAFQEAHRVLKKGGIFCVGVPDAARYIEFKCFSYYWLLLREHIQHFDVTHLGMLAQNEGFELVGVQQLAHPMLGDKVVLPTLQMVFEKTSGLFTRAIFKKTSRFFKRNDFGKYNQQDLCEKMIDYLIDAAELKAGYVETIDRLRETQTPIYLCGATREMYFLYESCGLKQCNIIDIIDTNTFKQRKYLIGERRIMGNEALEKAPKDSTILITAVAHTEQIKNFITSLGFNGKIITFE